MKNLKEIKTTTIGIILIALSIFTFLFKSFPDTVEGIIFVMGVAFLFFPDSFLLALKKLINKKSKEL